MKLKTFGLLCLGLSLNANAAFIATSTGAIDANKPTRIIVAGVPEKLGSLFVDSALTKAKVFLEKSKDEQIIIVGRNDDFDVVKRAGYKMVSSERGLLKQETIGLAISKVKLVKSMDVFAHSNATNGILLDKNAFTNQFLEEIDPVWDAIKAKSKSDTYIMFQGCNAGVKLAPWVAEKTGLAVLGALTGTDFQDIYNNSYWAHDYNGKKEELSTTTTLLTTDKELNCRSGLCTRMKPINSTYKGYWGDWSEGGYPTYKIFCGSDKAKHCAAGAVEAVKTFPSIMPSSQITTLEKFKEVAQDFLCPYGHNASIQNECINALESSLTDESSTYSPFRGMTLNCDFKKCYAHFDCPSLKASIAPGSCKLKNEKVGSNSTFTNEYRFLVESYKAQEAHE